MRSDTILDRAKELIHGERQANYGPPAANFKRIAGMWSETLGIAITPEQVVLCMIQLKIARMCVTPGHEDTMLDIAGYAGILERLSE